MLRRFLSMCRNDTERFIDLPRTGYFKKNASSIRLCYIKNGEYEYINLATPLEVAQFLKKNGVIQWYRTKDDFDVKMFKQELVTKTGKNQEPIQKAKDKLTLFEWDEIELTASEVRRFAARYDVEHNKEVRKFIRQNFQAA